MFGETDSKERRFARLRFAPQPEAAPVRLGDRGTSKLRRSLPASNLLAALPHMGRVEIGSLPVVKPLKRGSAELRVA
jgi:hypothetical protein